MRNEKRRRLPEASEVIEKLSGAIENSAEMLTGSLHVELESNRSALVDGCAGVLEYTDSSVRLNTEKFILRFTGRELSIVSMQNGQTTVTGFIAGIEYLN